jgi:hypothetical protein
METLPSKIVISTPWEALYVDLVGIYTGSSINFMALTMIDLDRFQHFELMELPTIYRLITKKENGKERTIEETSSISQLIKLLDKLTQSGW